MYETLQEYILTSVYADPSVHQYTAASLVYTKNFSNEYTEITMGPNLRSVVQNMRTEQSL